MTKVLLLVLLGCLCVSTSQNAEADWVDPVDLQVDFLVQPFFAGYLEANGKQFFYAYHPSEGNARKDPVVFWFGSGPGCSGLYSMFYSKGPYIFTRNQTTFRLNNYAWNKEANVVFLESPGHVGYSMGGGNSSDKELSEDHLQALISFYAKFPALKDQDLYLAGEGYAGIYIPWLANKVYQHNNDAMTLPDQHIPLKGLFLGNPCTDTKECHNHTQYNQYSYEYLQNHYFYTPEQYSEYKRSCLSIHTVNCDQVRSKLDGKFHTTGVNRRNIFEECLEQKTDPYPNIPCLDQIGILTYLNIPSIRKALHSNLSSDSNWTMCNPEVQENYNRDDRGSYFLYPFLMRHYKITIYSGALDASNPISGSLKWIQRLREQHGVATIKPWTVWDMNGVNGGDLWKMSGLTFASVRSAGHMVFTDQQQLGYYLFDSFLKGKL